MGIIDKPSALFYNKPKRYKILVINPITELTSKTLDDLLVQEQNLTDLII